MSLSRSRERRRPFPPRKFVGVQVPIIPYYQRFRYEQEIKGLKDRDELELYPEDTRIFTENVIKRVFAREMEWDGKQWVRKRILPLQWGKWEILEFNDIVPPGETLTILNKNGKGFFVAASFKTNYKDSVFQLWLDGVEITRGTHERPRFFLDYSTYLNWESSKGVIGECIVFDEINNHYAIIYKPVLNLLPFSNNISAIVKNPDTVNSHGFYVMVYYTLV